MWIIDIRHCRGVLQIQFDADDRIHWFCPERADEGLIDG
jgi:hypothetical protein